MQVQTRYLPGLHSHSSSEHQHQVCVNGTPSAAYPQSAGTTSPSKSGEMNPYHPYYHQQQQQRHQQQEQQQYAAAPPSAASLQQQQQYPSNHLPPMYPSMHTQGSSGRVLPGPSNSAMFNPAAQLPPPLGSAVRQHQQEPPRRQLSTTGSNGKYNFALKVEQQPARARMCGFGDKDRRPITPPPCIKLVITDMAGNPVSPRQVEGVFFVLQVDLWDEHAQCEVNIVRSNSSAPSTSISNASLTSYPPTPDRPPPTAAEFGHVMYTAAGQQVFAAHAYHAHPGLQYPNYYLPSMSASAVAHPYYQTGRTQEPSNLYTRNLIGSLTVNASVLKDPNGSEDYWFVLQDLSVRTEGFFRLKMSFVDVGNPDGEGLNMGKAPVLASVYSENFQVYSAKKFPGVIESTPLSKCFASQGIKIPIRKDVKVEERDDGGEEED